jgi:hypothetical protein
VAVAARLDRPGCAVVSIMTAPGAKRPRLRAEHPAPVH